MPTFSLHFPSSSTSNLYFLYFKDYIVIMGNDIYFQFRVLAIDLVKKQKTMNSAYIIATI